MATEHKKSLFNQLKKVWNNSVSKMENFLQTKKEKKCSSHQTTPTASPPLPDESENSKKIPTPSSQQASVSPTITEKSDNTKEKLSTISLPPSPPPPVPSTSEKRPEEQRRVEISASDLLEAMAKLKPVSERKKVGRNEVGAENPSTSLASPAASMPSSSPCPTPSTSFRNATEKESEEPTQSPPPSAFDPDFELQLRSIDEQLRGILVSIVEGRETVSTDQPHDESQTSTSLLDSTNLLEQLRLIEEQVARMESLVLVMEESETIPAEPPHEEPLTSPSSPDLTDQVENNLQLTDQKQSNFDYGLNLFHMVKGGKLAKKEKFESFAKLSGRYKDLFLIFTDKRLIITSANGKIKWETKLEKINGRPSVVHEFGNIYSLALEYKCPKYIFRPKIVWNQSVRKLELFQLKTQKMVLLEPEQHFLDHHSRV